MSRCVCVCMCMMCKSFYVTWLPFVPIDRYTRPTFGVIIAFYFPKDFSSLFILHLTLFIFELTQRTNYVFQLSEIFVISQPYGVCTSTNGYKKRGASRTFLFWRSTNGFKHCMMNESILDAYWATNNTLSILIINERLILNTLKANN